MEVYLKSAVIIYVIDFTVALRQSGLHQFQAVIIEDLLSFPTVINPTGPRGNFMYCTFYTYNKYKYCIPAYWCVSYDSSYKEKIFPYAAIAGYLLYPRQVVFTARYGLTLYRSQCTLKHEEAVPWLKRLEETYERRGLGSFPGYSIYDV